MLLQNRERCDRLRSVAERDDVDEQLDVGILQQRLGVLRRLYQCIDENKETIANDTLLCGIEQLHDVRRVWEDSNHVLVILVQERHGLEAHRSEVHLWLAQRTEIKCIEKRLWIRERHVATLLALFEQEAKKVVADGKLCFE
jgi:hypothetical protein